jgi:hypothetical protein
MTTIAMERLSFLNDMEQPPLSGIERAFHENDNWGVRSSDLTKYCIRAGLPNDRNFRSILDARLGYSPDNVGLDIAGGSGLALRELTDQGIIGRGIVTNFLDKRKPYERFDILLDHIDGNILDQETWEKIIARSDEVAPKGLALVMHQPVGALQRLSPRFYEQATHLLLDLMRPGGVMLGQIPGTLKRTSSDEQRREILKGIRQRPDVEEVVLPMQATVSTLSCVAIIKAS